MVYDETSKMLKETFMQVVRENLEIAESTEQANEIIKKFEKIDLNDFYKKAYSDITDNAVKYIKDEMYKEVMLFRTQEQEFLARQEQKWCNAFVASEAYSKYVDSLNEKEREGKTCRFTAMMHIHGRVLQEFLEIITLMKNGFADGVYARWRSYV